MKLKKGFTLLETAIVVVAAGLLTALATVQKSNLDAMERDETRKTAINAMYYALENSFYPAYGYYPEEISPAILPVVRAELWTDPDGYALGDALSSYIYMPANCNSGQCREYTLKARLEKEDTYIKYNKN